MSKHEDALSIPLTVISDLRVERDKLRAEVERLKAQLNAIRSLVDEQAENEGLWFLDASAPEAYLQQELRRLHGVVEKELGDV